MDVTLRQLQTLVALADTGSLRGAANVMGATTAQQVTKSMARLVEALALPGSLYAEDDDGHVTITSEWVLKKARTVVNEHRDLIARAQDTRQFWVRIDAFGSHLATFIPPAIAEFERRNPEIRVDLVPGFGFGRSTGGAGMLQGLAHGNAEVMIFPRLPLRKDVVPPGLPTPTALYRSILIAAIGVEHPFVGTLRNEYKRQDSAAELAAFEERLARRRLRSADLVHGRLVTSPPNHLTHSLLLDQESSTRQFPIETSNPDPMALVALGQHTSRVPVIASDSAVMWPKMIKTRSSGSVPKWMAIVDDDDQPIAWDFEICWQDSEARVPGQLLEPIKQLKDLLVVHADELRKRVNWWL